MIKIKHIKPSCPGCGSKQVLTNKGGDRRRCRVCGQEWDPRDENDLKKVVKNEK